MSTDIEKIKNLHAGEKHQVFFHDEVGLLLERISALEATIVRLEKPNDVKVDAFEARLASNKRNREEQHND